MSRTRNSEKKSRNFALLLYPDNPDHVAVLDFICNSEYNYRYIGILHHGQEGGKDHWHIYVCFENPRYGSAVSVELGLFDTQFIRPLFGKFTDCLLYLVHKNAPEKEQYDYTDCFGADDLRKKVGSLCLKYDRNDLDMSEAVSGCLDWIQQQDGYIRSIAFARWACSSAYFKGASHSLVRMALEEHNGAVRRSQEESGGFKNGT